MADETTINDYSPDVPRFRITEEGDQTIIRDYATGAPRFRINGKIAGVEVMTTAERMAITPEAGQLIYDTDLNLLFVGDGETVGGNVVAGGGGSGGIIPGYRLYTSGGVTSFNPTDDIVNVTGNSVTLQPDTAYKIMATGGAVNITANPPAANKWAYEGHAEIFVAGTGYVVVDRTKVVLADALEPDSVNNCTLRFHDGRCYISVEDHIAGYVVYLSGGTYTDEDGTLPYGITSATESYIAFDASLNGSAVNLSGSTANGEKHVVGNGYAETIVGGTVHCGDSKFTVVNLSLQDVVVGGGTMTLGDAYIPSGSTVAVSGGGLAVEKVIGDGGTINLGQTTISISSGATAYVSGATVAGGLSSAFNVLNSGTLVLSGCVLSGTPGTYTGIYTADSGAKVEISGCTVTGRASTNGFYVFGGHAKVVDSLLDAGTYAANIWSSIASADLSGCTATKVIRIQAGKMVFSGGTATGGFTFTGGGSVTLAGSVAFPSKATGSSGKILISSGAVVDLTGNANAAPIAPGGGIAFEPGGATVLYSSGAVSGSYMMDNVTLPAGAKLTNTNVVDLGGNNFYASDCRISGANFGTGFLYVSSTSVLNDITVSGGRVILFEGSVATDITGSGYSVLDVSSGCTMSRAIVENHAQHRVFSGGTSIEPIISSGGSLTVVSGGSALLVTSNAGAAVNVNEGGYITYKE